MGNQQLAEALLQILEPSFFHQLFLPLVFGVIGQRKAFQSRNRSHREIIASGRHLHALLNLLIEQHLGSALHLPVCQRLQDAALAPTSSSSFVSVVTAVLEGSVDPFEDTALKHLGERRK
jgi:hypothetical protein